MISAIGARIGSVARPGFISQSPGRLFSIGATLAALLGGNGFDSTILYVPELTDTNEPLRCLEYVAQKEICGNSCIDAVRVCASKGCEHSSELGARVLRGQPPEKEST